MKNICLSIFLSVLILCSCIKQPEQISTDATENIHEPFINVTENIHEPFINVTENATESLDEPPTELPTINKEDIWRDNSKPIIDNITEELKSKGWKNIQCVEGWGNWRDWGTAVILPNYDEQNMFMFTIWGQWEGLAENTLTAGVRVVFDDESPNGKIYKVFYTSLAARYLDPDDASNDPLETNEILSIDNEYLLGFMYSY